MSLDDQQGVSTIGDFGNRTDEYCPSVSRHPLLIAVNTIIACFAVLGNGMVITVMLARRRVFSSFTNHLILHQSVIDSIAGVIFFLHKAVRAPVIVVSAEGNIYDQLTCRIVGLDALLWCVNVTSSYSLVVISLERFVAICYPVKHRNACSSAKLKIAVATIWGIGLIYGSHLLFMLEARQGCCLAIEFGLGVKVFITMVEVGMQYVVPMAVMIYAYTRILIALTKKLANPVNGQQNTMSRAKKNVLVTTLMIGVMFLVCWTPFEVWLINAHISGNPDNLGYIVVTGLVACNQFVNPIIYCFKYEHFRSQLKDLVLRRLRRNRVHDGESISIPTRSLQLHTNESV